MTTRAKVNATALRAIVTGATSGIGSAIATAVAAGGGAVCLIGRIRERLEVAVQQARATGDTAVACQSDLADDTARSDLLTRVKTDFQIQTFSFIVRASTQAVPSKQHRWKCSTRYTEPTCVHHMP